MLNEVQQLVGTGLQEIGRERVKGLDVDCMLRQSYNMIKVEVIMARM